MRALAEPVPAGRVHAATGRDLWRARVEATPDRRFLVEEDGRTWSFAEADERMRRLAGGLEAAGVGRGTRVAVGMANSVRTLLVHAALRELAAVIVPLVPGLTSPELRFQLEHSAAEMLIAGDPVAAVLDAAPRVGTVIADGVAPAGATALDALLEGPPRPPAREPLDELAPWAIFYTSGSTGRPKGVVLPAGAFPSAGSGYADRFGVRADDTYILPTSMAHAVGGLTAPCISLYTGCALAVVDRFSPSRFWGQVERAGATVSILFPAHLNLLLELEAQGPPRGATTLRLVITHAWLDAFRDRFGVELGLCWGMTETGAASTGTGPGDPGGGPGCVGPGMHGVEVAVVDEGGRRLAAGEVGEIWLRHRHRMLGYLDDEAATREVMDADGWIHSGDLGTLDDRGRLYYRGRIKNLIKRSGENVSPEEVEAALEAHPGVAECLVVGVPDPLRTEEVAAVVVTAPGARVDPDDLTAFASATLARYKLPRYVLVRDTPLPRLSGGKVDRRTVLDALDLAACWDRQRQSGAPSKP